LNSNGIPNRYLKSAVDGRTFAAVGFLPYSMEGGVLLAPGFKDRRGTIRGPVIHQEEFQMG